MKYQYNISVAWVTTITSMYKFSYNTFVNAANAANAANKSSTIKSHQRTQSTQKCTTDVCLSNELLNNQVHRELLQHINSHITSIGSARGSYLRNNQILYLLQVDQNIYAKNIQQIYFLTNKINTIASIIKKYSLISTQVEYI